MPSTRDTPISRSTLPFTPRVARPARFTALFVLVFALAALGAAGCVEPFEPAWRVDGYRLLAMRAEPATVQPGDVSTLSVLDHAEPGQNVTYRWEWCPFRTSADNEYACPIDRLREASGTSPDAGPGFSDLPEEIFSLGSGPTARLPYPGTKEQVRRICERIRGAIGELGSSSPLAGAVPKGGCDRNYEVDVRLIAEPDGAERVVTRKRVPLRTGTDGEASNTSPTHRGIEIRLADRTKASTLRERLDWVAPESASGDERWHALSERAPTPVVAGATYRVRADADSKSLETWRPPAPAGSDKKRLDPEAETWTFRWFASDGNLRRAEKVFNRKRGSLDKAARSTIELPSELADGCPTEASQRRLSTDAGPSADTSTGDTSSGDASSSPPAPRSSCDVFLWSIVRDNRLGVDWAERRLRVVGSL